MVGRSLRVWSRTLPAAVGWAAGLALVLPAGSGGCSRPHAPTEQQFERGYIMMLPGVESYDWSMTGIQRGLEEAGISAAVEVIVWGEQPFGTFVNLNAVEQNHQKAAKYAEMLVAYQRKHPDRPISLIGYSGGAAIALWTLEALPEGVFVDRLVLLGAAVSPGYDLGPALGHCRGGIVNFYSRKDWVTIEMGTRLFGTMDRVNTYSAGHSGFETAPGELLRMPGLYQLGWEPAWRALNHWGEHTGWREKNFNREMVAAWIFSPAGREAMRMDPATATGPAGAPEEEPAGSESPEEP